MGARRAEAEQTEPGVQSEHEDTSGRERAAPKVPEGHGVPDTDALGQ